MTDERRNGLDPEQRRVREAVRALDRVHADPEFRERLKRSFVSGTIDEAAEPKPERKRLAWAWLLVPAAALLLLLLLRPSPSPTWSIRGVQGVGSIAFDGRSVEAGDALATKIDPGARVRVDEAVVLDLILDDRLLLELDDGADVALPAVATDRDGSVLTGEVLAGELRVKTGPGFAGAGLHLVTSEGRVEIVGTAISVFKMEGVTCVCVLEGTARIGANEAGLEVVPSGMRKVMFADGRPPMITELEPQHETGLLDFLERHRDAFHTAD